MKMMGKIFSFFIIVWLVDVIRHLGHCFEQLCQIDDALRHLLQFMTGCATLFHLLDLVALMPFAHIVPNCGEILVHLPQDASVRSRNFTIVLKGTLFECIQKVTQSCFSVGGQFLTFHLRGQI